MTTINERLAALRAEMKKDGSIVSPVRCKWEPAEK